MTNIDKNNKKKVNIDKNYTMINKKLLYLMIEKYKNDRIGGLQK